MKRLSLFLVFATLCILALYVRPASPGEAATQHDYSRFAGQYWFHLGLIMVRPNGWGVFSEGYTFSCPHGIGSCGSGYGVGYGGRRGPYATFQLTSQQGNVGWGYVLTDSDPAFLGLGVRVVHHSGYPQIVLTLPDFVWSGCTLPLSSTYREQCGA